ncbi:MAG: DUF4982 domain-containing protein [Clostridia bacterium]|nr:DUF4982 domain-containing protein [Clostridia bacterium]
MKKTCISKDWYVVVAGEKRIGNYLNEENSDYYGRVDLPHDFAISLPRLPDAAGGPFNGYFQGGRADYTKHLTFDADTEHVILDVDGSNMHTEVMFNEDILYKHHHGYTPFLVDLTSRVRRGGLTNKLRMRILAQQPSTRWYAGGGLYRDVCLWTGGKVRLEPWDVFVTTPRVTAEDATVRVDATVSSDIVGDAILRARILDDTGTVVATHDHLVMLDNLQKNPTAFYLHVPAPRLWDLDSPTRYTLVTDVMVNGEITDTDETKFGIRTIHADAKNGFSLNGRKMKLKGGCMHHTHGVLGAADFPEAVERQIRQLKAAGYNAIRSAHNPPSTTLLEVCDRLGMLLMDEAFDMWRVSKTILDYNQWFEYCWADDIMRMVKRDRNHPCVISYSIGNEIEEIHSISDGGNFAKKLVDRVREFDNTKFVTTGGRSLFRRLDEKDPEDYQRFFNRGYPDSGYGEIESSWNLRTEQFFAQLDIVGYNYLYYRYENDKQLYPERVIWGSESRMQHFYDSWKATVENDNVIGDFCWTCYDNLGEAGTGRFDWARDYVHNGLSLGDFSWIACYQGDFDLCGYRRPQSYYREAIWQEDKTEHKIFTTHPEHFGEGFSGTTWHWYDVHETWTFSDEYLGKPVKAEVYTQCDEVVWILNGRELCHSVPEKAIASATIPYERGSLEAILYKDGKEYARCEVHTVGAPARLTISAEKSEIRADNLDLCYLPITVTDANGEWVTDSQEALTCTVTGGELLGIFSGNPQSTDHYTTPECHAFEGRALAIVRAKEAGVLRVTVKGETLGDASVELIAK